MSFLFPAEISAQPVADTCMELNHATATLPIATDTTVLANIQASENEIVTVPPTRLPAWVFVIFLVQIALVAYLRASFPKGTEEMMKAVMSINMAQQLYREQQQAMPVSAIFYNINFILSVGMFLFLLNRHFVWVHYEQPIVTLLFIMWLVILVYSLKYGSMKLVSVVFPFGSAVDYYSFNFFLVQKMLGMALIPFNLLIAYAPESLRFAIILLSLIFIGALVVARSLRGFMISRNLFAANTFHFIVYICALEIAPVCILVKVVVDG